jgi:alkylation response protein AidB-like acyl-CoA dehydrogenase
VVSGRVASEFDYPLDDEHEALRSTVADFARQVVAPRAAAMDEAGAFPYDIVTAMAAMGLFGLPFPQEFGGMGGDYFALCLAIEELARVRPRCHSGRCRSFGSAATSSARSGCLR